MIDIKLCGPLWERDQILSALSERMDQTEILSAPSQTPHYYRMYFRPGSLISDQFDDHSRQNLTSKTSSWQQYVVVKFDLA